MRDEAGVSDLMIGIRFARNASVHGELAQLAQTAGGWTFPIAFPAPIVVVARWIDEDVPPGHSSQQASYLRELAGKEVIPTLQRAVRWLSDLKPVERD